MAPLDQCSDHSGKSHKGTDRKIDLTSNDHHQHANRKDSGYGGLSDEVRKVTRSQENAASRVVESGPDQDKGDNHSIRAKCLAHGELPGGERADLLCGAG